MRRILRWAQTGLFFIAAISIIFVLRSQWQELATHEWRLNTGWLALSAGLMLVSWLVEIEVWRSILTHLGGRLPHLASVRIWFLSAIVRYVPGNVWQPLSMVLYCERYGVRPEASVTSVALYQIIILLAAAPIAVAYFAVTGNWGLFTASLSAIGPWLLAATLLPPIIFVARPDLLIALLNWLMNKLKRPALEARLSRSAFLWLLVWAAIDWLFWGASFAALTFGIADFSPGEMQTLAPHLIASYAIAYAIGFVSFITPSGFGVREGVFFVLLTPLMGGVTATVAALAMRLWTMLGEIIMALLSAATGREVIDKWGATVAPPFEQESHS
jgi:hypothetical protein